jgi:hypothetical protein
MLGNNLTSSSTIESSNSSIELDGGEVASSNNIVEYGPIKIRVCQKPAPTIATGRRPKHLVLVGDEAIRREKRREKNREAARKLKEKRQLIEQELDEKLRKLEDEHSNLQRDLIELHQKRQNLQEKVNQILSAAIDELLSNDNEDISISRQDSIDLDLFDESINRILNFDWDTSFNSLINN